MSEETGRVAEGEVKEMNRGEERLELEGRMQGKGYRVK